MADAHAFKLIAGNLALDFANTLDNRFDAARTEELLATYDDFLRFCRQTHVINATEAAALAASSEREKQNALRSARELRELMERVFSAVARRARIDQDDLAPLNTYIQKALEHRRLSEERGKIRWSWHDLTSNAVAPLWPITLAAADLLTSDDLRYVRECGIDTCRWLFLDLRKNHSRRWCDMKVCGNRAKARRYYQAHS